MYMRTNGVLIFPYTTLLRSDGSVYLNGTAGSTLIINSGTIKKSAGVSGSNFTVPLTMQSGSQFQVQSSIMYLGGTLTNTGSTFTVSTVATLYFYYTDTRTFN